MELPFDRVIPLLGIYPKNPETPEEPTYPNVHSSTIYNSQVLEATQVPISKQVDKKLWYIYTVEFYAAERKKELLPLQQHGLNWRALC